MKYNLTRPFDLTRFTARVRFLIKKGAIVELTEKQVRTGNQNAYLHALLGVVALEYGERLEYVKTEYYKRLVNPDLFCVQRDDRFLGRTWTLRSSADLTTEEMSISLDRFKQWARENGMVMPEPGDDSLLAEIEVEMARLHL